jgi:hypothetical protein
MAGSDSTAGQRLQQGWRQLRVGRFPASTAQDWVTYGDYLLELRATSEVTLQPDEDELAAGEGLFRRRFAFAVERVLWRRPGVRHPPPTEHHSVSGGWQFEKGDLKTRKRFNDPDQLRVGDRYVGIFTHDGQGAAEGGAEWWCFSRLPVEKDKIRRLNAKPYSGSAAVLTQLRGLTPNEAGALLARTPPDPAVVPYLDQDAIDRYQLKVRAEGHPPAKPGPGER